MEGKGSFIILLVIIAILSLALVGLAGYVFFFATPSQNNTTEDVVQEEVKEIPSPDDLIKINLFNSEKIFFNLKDSDRKKNSVIQMDIEIQYYKKIKGVKGVDKKISAYDGKIKETVETYFQNMTYDQATKLPEAKDTARDFLINKINEILNEGEKEKKDFVYTITFNKWFYQ